MIGIADEVIKYEIDICDETSQIDESRKNALNNANFS